MQYGNTETVRILDEQGSTQKTEKNIVQGEVKKPVRQTYKYRERVANKVEEQQAYINFSEELSRDTWKLDPAFVIDRTSLGDKEGYYYVIKQYTTLEY